MRPSATQVVTVVAAQTPWKSLNVEDVLCHARTSHLGLTSEEAALRLEEDGPNALPTGKRKSLLERVWGQIFNVLIIILLAAAIVQLVLQHYADSAFVLLVVVVNVIIGVIQEGKAESAAEAISKLLAPNAVVTRDNGKTIKIDAENLVAGDILQLKAGDRIPADARVIESTELQVLEAILTGESAPRQKHPWPIDEDTPLADSKNMVYSGTLVALGQGRAVVVATGQRAEIGQISEATNQVERPKTPLMIQLNKFGLVLSMLTILLAVLTLLVSHFARGVNIDDAFATSVGIAVAIVPEGLPAVVTVTLALAVKLMAKHNAIVRNLPTVETLGCVSVICSDKTGTLTKNEMTVTTFCTPAGQYTVTGIGYAPEGKVVKTLDSEEGQDQHQHEHQDQDQGDIVDFSSGASSSLAAEHNLFVNEQSDGLLQLMLGAVLCNTSSLARTEDGRWTVVGNPTEGALLSLYDKMINLRGLDVRTRVQQSHPCLGTIPFQSEHKFMATLHDLSDPNKANLSSSLVAMVKGAPDRLLARCSSQAVGNNPWASEPIQRELWEARLTNLASQGLRVIALCRWVLPLGHASITQDDILKGEPKLQIDALVGITDPPRPEAIASVQTCHQAGIVVKMITGDAPQTAETIGKALHIDTKYVLTGPMLDQLTPDELYDRVLECNIYARVTPQHKLQIIKALLQHKLVTAMTGDGVNDAPALKQASVGVAMGITGTEVAKDAASMILADDNFATIEIAVRQGRCVFDNLLKTLAFVLPTNFAQGLSISIAVFIGIDIPLRALQVLYVNMITSVTLGVVLALEKPEADIMERPPRPNNKSILGKWLAWRSFFTSAVIIVFVLVNMEWERQYHLELSHLQTVSMATLLLCQCTYVFNCRFLRSTSLRSNIFTENKALTAIALLNVVMLCLLIYLPGLSDLFGLVALGGGEWGRCLLCAVLTFVFVEIEKAVGAPSLHAIFRLGWMEKKSNKNNLHMSDVVIATGCDGGGGDQVMQAAAADDGQGNTGGLTTARKKAMETLV